MNTKAWFNICTVVCVVLLLVALLLVAGAHILGWSVLGLVLMAGVFFVSRDIQW